MRTIRLGRTGLETSVAGLGCGGHSRLGQTAGASTAQSVALVHAALDLGLTFIDTAASYGTEEIVGAALAGRRDSAILSTKQQVVRPGTKPDGTDFVTAAEFTAGVEEGLRRLGTDYVDILHLHGVMPGQYEYCRAELVPALLRLRDDGKIRFLGLTERFIKDTTHDMLDQALEDGIWDVMMVGFNMLNPSARRRVLPRTRQRDIGMLNMFAVRRALSRPDALAALVRSLAEAGLVETAGLDDAAPLDFLTAPGVARSLPEAAYRFCVHEPGINLVLTGTGKVAHLKENVAAINGPPLPGPVRARLAALFGAVDTVSGN